MSLNTRKPSTNTDRVTPRKPAASESMTQHTTRMTTPEPILAPLAERSLLKAKMERSANVTATATSSTGSVTDIEPLDIAAFVPEAQKNKSELVVSLLRTASGATIDEIMNTTNWQKHSVRGFLSGTVRKKLRLNLIREVAGDGVRRYRIENFEALNHDSAGCHPVSVMTEGDHHATLIAKAD